MTYPWAKLGRLFLTLAVVGAPGAAGPEGSSPPASGLVVEAVLPGSTADRAGLAAEDVLVSWTREPAPANPRPAAGALESSFDLADVLLEQAPRGRVALRGRRGSEDRTWILPGGFPAHLADIEAAPVLSGELRSLYDRAREAERSSTTPAESWHELALAAKAQGARSWSAWFLVRSARALARAGHRREAYAAYEAALALLDEPHRPTAAAAQVLREAAELAQRDDEEAWERSLGYLQRALALDRKLARESLAESSTLTRWAVTETESSGAQDPEDFLRRALLLRRRQAPGSSAVAESLHDRAVALMRLRRPAQALRWAERALVAETRIAPESLERVDIEETLASLALQQGQLERAGRLWRHTLELASRQPPRPVRAVALQGLGLVAERRGQLGEAQARLEEALRVATELLPGSEKEGEIAHDLGRVEGRAGDREASAAHLCQAVQIAEDRFRKIERYDEIRVRWGVMYGAHYRDCAIALVAVGQGERAFAVLERSRARAFLNRIAERDVRRTSLPPAAAALWQEKSQEYEQVEERLDRLGSPKDARRRRSLEGRIREIRFLKEQILREFLPDLATVPYPEPLDLSQTRAMLDPGTALLLYAVAEKQTLLFVALPQDAASPGWSVFPLAIGEAALRRRVEGFRASLQSRGADPALQRRMARRLYDLLLKPGEPLFGQARRLLILADGALHTLPFAALVRHNRYLVEWKPVHLALSATVYSLLRRPGGEAGRARERFVAFGDPIHPGAAPSLKLGYLEADRVLRQAIRRGFAPLPASREEVEGIARLFKEKRVFLGKDATKARALRESQGSGIFHFAVHGLLDADFPLNSALVLSRTTASGRARDEMLQAWEVMESLHLDADLVTLSACDTALGLERGGEGLVGMTRAFQIAGTRSVAGTLWGIADGSTGVLMKEFYRQLRAGRPKDEALRTAQIKLLRSARWKAPVYWAGFELFGDWE